MTGRNTVTAAAPDLVHGEPRTDGAPRRTEAWLAVGLVVALGGLALVSAGVGAYGIPVGEVLGSVQHRLGLGGAPLDRVGESVLWNVRLPGSRSPCSSVRAWAARGP